MSFILEMKVKVSSHGSWLDKFLLYRAYINTTQSMNLWEQCLNAINSLSTDITN